MTGSHNGTITIWNNEKAIESFRVKGTRSFVKTISNMIIVSPKDGNLELMGEKMSSFKSFNSDNIDPRSVSGNEVYLAYGDYNGTVVFYDIRDSKVRKVSWKIYCICSK